MGRPLVAFPAYFWMSERVGSEPCADQRRCLAGPSVCAIFGSLEKREKIGSGPTRFDALVFAAFGQDGPGRCFDGLSDKFLIEWKKE